MDLAHDTAGALARVVALVNSGPATSGAEALPDVDALTAYAARLGIAAAGVETAPEGRRISEPPGVPGEADLDAVRRLRSRFHAVFLARDDDTAVGRVNAILCEGHMAPHLTSHDGYAWHLHYFAPAAPLVQRLSAAGGMALALVIAAGERERLRSCEAPGCHRVLVDLSRNRSRRYCDSRTCGNRLHVAAYRARRRQAAENEAAATG